MLKLKINDLFSCFKNKRTGGKELPRQKESALRWGFSCTVFKECFVYGGVEKCVFCDLCMVCVCLCVCDYFLVDVSSDCLFSFPSLYSQMLYYRLPDFRGLPIFRTPSITVRHSLPSPAIYLVILIMLIRTIFFIFCYFFFVFFFCFCLPLLLLRVFLTISPIVLQNKCIDTR